jgi:serine/threonine-protein kinase HipA
MKRCPITYENIPDNVDYSQQGLHSIARQLNHLHPLALSAVEQREEAVERSGKMSIQGIQPKLSAQLKIKEGYFKIVDQNGHYILKPQSFDYPELPQNEALTMTLAATIDLEVPAHGLLYSKDSSMTYFIKRFDRIERNKKIAVEDFSQLLGFDRHTKYNSSMEQVVSVIKNYCTFPMIELAKLFKITLFNYLIGNEDMHLKNFSLITRNQKVTLSPAYDFLNSTIAQKKAKEEIALPLKGKKNNLTKNDFLKYFAIECLNLNEKTIINIILNIQKKIPAWKILVHNSFLSNEMQKKYLELLETRCQRLGIL